MIIQHNKKDIGIDLSERDGDFDARKVRVNILAANQDTVLWHKLGRKPRHIEITWKDGYLDFKVSQDAQKQPMVDDEKAVLQFSAAGVTAEIRFA